MIGVDAGFWKAQAIDRTTVNEVLLDDLLGIASVSKPVPDGFRVDDKNGGVFALVEAACFIDADAVFETGSFDGIFKRSAKFFTVFIPATWARGGFVALIHADEEVVFVGRHRLFLMLADMEATQYLG